MISSDYRLKLPPDNAKEIVGDERLKGMSTEDAVKLPGELIGQ